MGGKEKTTNQSCESEMCFNLWYYVDAEAGFVYAISGRAYWMSGTDDEKFLLLRKLSATDYKMAARYKLPDRFHLHIGDEVKDGYTLPEIIKEQGINVFEEMIQRMETEFPTIPITINGETVMQEMRTPANPLCVYTALKEESIGEITPMVA
jgi:hypothetical protein